MNDTHPHDDDGPDAAAETPTRRLRGPDPLSLRSRRKLLAALSKAAEGGDVDAMRTLIELGRAAEQDARVAKALALLKADDTTDGSDA